jgi:pimeloyl-ACP methyl ester carboxylesterase
MAAARLVLIPGLGADGQLFTAVRHLSPLITPWLPVDGGDLASYARRYVAQGLVQPGDLLGGCSFGGMLAQEITRLIPLRGLLLITTCRSAAGVTAGPRALAPFTRLLPVLSRPAPLIARLLGHQLGAVKPAHFRAVESWVRNGEPRYLRWAARIAGTWRGVGPLTLPVFQIHGSHDRLMPVAQSGADTIIPGAGHLLPITHPAEFTAWMERSLAAVETGLSLEP